MMVSEFKCIFMHSLERTVQRNVDNKYVYYRSINLLTQNTNSYQEKNSCDLKLNLLQFKIHLNLKNDYEIEMFYEKCGDYLVKLENNFNHTKKQCFREFEFDNKEIEENKNLNSIFKFVSNEYFLITLILLGSILVPAFIVVAKELKSSKSESQNLILVKRFAGNDIEIPMSVPPVSGDNYKIGKENIKFQLREDKNKNCGLVVEDVDDLS